MSPISRSGHHPNADTRGQINRTRLLRILDEAPQHRLVLVAGPPGSGKTTILNQWAETLPTASTAWVNASRLGDVGMTGTWAAVVAASQESWPESGGLPPLRQGVLDLGALRAMFDGGDDAEPHHRYLIVDDAHAIRDATVHRALLSLVADGPKLLHLVVGTRSDPEMPLHRMRAQGDLLELRDAELRFSRAEIEAFLLVNGLDFLTPAQLDVVEARTEGWSTGLALLAISLRRAEDPDAFLATFAGTDRNIADYLIHEVLDQQPDDVRRFLLDTSPLDVLTPELCGIVTGQDDPLRFIELLEREHLFVSRADAAGTALRYHELFRDMLRHVLRVRQHDRERVVLSAAASWHAENDDYPRAINEWLDAGQFEMAVAAISKCCDHMVDDDGNVEMVRHWVDRTPQLARSGDLWRILGHASRLGWVRSWEQQESVLDRARELIDGRDLGPSERDEALSVMAVLTGYAALSRSAVVEAKAEFEAAATKSPIGGPLSHPLARASATRALLGLSLSATLAGDVDQARVAGRDVVRWAGTDPSSLLAARNISALADYADGRVADARRRLNRLAADAAASTSGCQSTTVASLASLLSGWIAVEDMRYQDGCQHFEELVATTMDPMGPIALLAELGLVAAEAATRSDEALRSVERLRHRRRDLTDPLTLGWIDATECGLLLDLGEVAAADRLAAGLPPLPTFASFRAAADLAGGRPDLARARWGPEADLPPRLRLARASIDVRAALLEGRPPPRAALIEVVGIGTEQGFAHTLVRGGGAVVVAQMVADPDLSHSDYVQWLRGQLERWPAPAVASWRLAGLVEPLSEREREVLRYLPTSLSSREIAAELFVSVNTLKTHIQAIYRKLGCNTRHEAVDRARTLRMMV